MTSKLIRCHLWEDTHFAHNPKTAGEITLGTAILINLDTVSSMVDKGNNPPAVSITFKREEARDPLTVFGSIASLEAALDDYPNSVPALTRAQPFGG